MVRWRERLAFVVPHERWMRRAVVQSGGPTLSLASYHIFTGVQAPTHRDASTTETRDDIRAPGATLSAVRRNMTGDGPTIAIEGTREDWPRRRSKPDAAQPQPRTERADLLVRRLSRRTATGC